MTADHPAAEAGGQAPAGDPRRRDEVGGLQEERSCGVRSLAAGPPDAPAHVVIVPGLGALGYLLPLVRELGDRGLRCSLLDLPGFGSLDDPGSPPSVEDVAAATARWCAALPDGRPYVLVGHSTGSQSALLAALRLQDDGWAPGAVVLAGPTIAPNQRSLPRLIARVPLAYRRDSPAELGVFGDYRRSGRGVLALLRSAIRDRPERNVRELRVPLLVTAGRQDAFAPHGWLVALAHGAASRSARVVRLPGSHNNPFTHPEAVATVIEAMAGGAGDDGARARRARRSRRVRAELRRSA